MERVRASERSGECRESNGAPNFPSIFREITMASLSSPSTALSRTKYPFNTLKDISSVVKAERIQTHQQVLRKLGIMDLDTCCPLSNL